MRTCLVTGGAGFIGSHVAHALVERGDKVRVLDNLCTGNLENLAAIRDRVEFIEGDVADLPTVERAVKGVQFVFHQAALASVPRSMEKPLDTHAACVTGTLNVLDAARRSGVKRVVYAASSSAYGNQLTASKRESDLPLPISPYGAAKLAGEIYCQSFAAAFGLETVCLRYFNVFGPRQDPNSEYSAVIPKFIAALLSGHRPTIFGDGRQSRDFTYVANVVQGNLLAAEAPDVAGRVFNVAMGQSIDLLYLIDAMNRVLGTKVQPEFAPPRAGDVRDSLADITLARAMLNYEPKIGFEEGLQKSIEYYKSIIKKA